MNDNGIIDLFFKRDELSLIKVADIYSKYAFTIAFRIISNKEDADECVNDTWLKLWNTIPPAKPHNLSAYIAKTTRNLAIDKYRHYNAVKRQSSEIYKTIDELDECIPSSASIEMEFEGNELTTILNSFLKTLNKKDRNIFIARYWYAKSISEISHDYSINENNINQILFRTRQKLKNYLESEDIHI